MLYFAPGSGTLPSMSEELRSILTGTAGLTVAAVAAILLTVARRPAGPDVLATARIGPWFVGGITVQMAHFAEELVTGFHLRFPALLGLEPWPARFFVNFNLVWITVWLFAVPFVRRGVRPVFCVVWFFSLAAMANGIAHPLLALGAAGYFPGLWTSPVLGLMGLVLWHRLWRATRPVS